jgi:hypothetical protein
VGVLLVFMMMMMMIMMMMKLLLLLLLLLMLMMMMTTSGRGCGGRGGVHVPDRHRRTFGYGQGLGCETSELVTAVGPGAPPLG